MPKIAICDDEQPIREYLKSLTEKCIPDSQVRLFGSGERGAQDCVAHEKYAGEQLYFL